MSLSFSIHFDDPDVDQIAEKEFNDSEDGLIIGNNIGLIFDIGQTDGFGELFVFVEPDLSYYDLGIPELVLTEKVLRKQNLYYDGDQILPLLTNLTKRLQDGGWKECVQYPDTRDDEVKELHDCIQRLIRLVMLGKSKGSKFKLKGYE